MKKQTLLVMGLMLMSLETAHAVVRTGWDRPIFRADLTVLDQEGRLPALIEDTVNAKSAELVMTQQDGTASPAGFVLLIDGEFKQAYEVKSTLKDSCNSVTYTLVAVQKPGSFRLDETQAKIQVTDHSDRICMDLHQYRWEMNVKNMDLTREVLGTARLAGNPRSVMTPL